LINKAAMTIERWRAEGFFGKRAQACFVQNLKLMHSAPSPAAQACADVMHEMKRREQRKWSSAMREFPQMDRALSLSNRRWNQLGLSGSLLRRSAARVTDGKALARCMASLEAGDVLLVAKLDRLARSTRDLLNTIAAIAGRGAGFRSLGDPWADTTTPHGTLMITVLGGLAEFERHLTWPALMRGGGEPRRGVWGLAASSS
jgi:hypothetical protein